MLPLLPNQRQLCICIAAPSSDAQSHLWAPPSGRLTVIVYTFWRWAHYLWSGWLHRASPNSWKSLQCFLWENATVIHHGKSLLSYGRPTICKGAWQHIFVPIHPSIQPLTCLCHPWTKALRDPGNGGHVPGEGHWRAVIHFVSLPFLSSPFFFSALIAATVTQSWYLLPRKLR